MVYTQEIEVMGIDSGRDIKRDVPLYRVGFGENFMVTAEIAQKAGGQVKDMTGQMVGLKAAEIVVPLEKNIPYVIGSKWILTVTDEGEVSIKRKR